MLAAAIEFEMGYRYCFGQSNCLNRISLFKLEEVLAWVHAPGPFGGVESQARAAHYCTEFCRGSDKTSHHWTDRNNSNLDRTDWGSSRGTIR
jgi:hypothetical protein